MNKIINIFSLILFIIFAFFAIGSIYDLGFSVYEVNDIPNIQAIVYGISALFLLLGLIRIKRRLDGKKDIRNFKQFVFAVPIAKNQINLSTLLISIELLFGFFFLFILLLIRNLDDALLTLPLLIIVSVLLLESLVYLIIFRSKRKAFKIGVSPKFVAYFDREMHLYYYKGLKRVEVYQNMLNFRYKKDLNLFLNLDVIPEEQKENFFNNLNAVLDTEVVFIDDSYHQYVKSLTNQEA
ncbi:hypothetical protein DNU06_03595 [Putridiphycobacter roseus]|uniref:Uncharacterized protein n=1 Tax=Putridiphycobacter roseus TaxID=2219161 RepID=A0A2W1N533_9FLAO|nr:hypothetical protein [Putridiphycobacter roseus]PZE18924.1 hypothetical protein DNU06_03595 [Putridiphycobacter roseus]